MPWHRHDQRHQREHASLRRPFPPLSGLGSPWVRPHSMGRGTGPRKVDLCLLFCRRLPFMPSWPPLPLCRAVPGSTRAETTTPSADLSKLSQPDRTIFACRPTHRCNPRRLRRAGPRPMRQPATSRTFAVRWGGSRLWLDPTAPIRPGDRMLAETATGPILGTLVAVTPDAIVLDGDARTCTVSRDRLMGWARVVWERESVS